MKFIIVESRLNDIIIQYLDSQNFVQEVKNTRGATFRSKKKMLVFNYPGDEEFPIYYNFEKRNLYIDTLFATELISLFRIEKDQMMNVIEEWFYIKTENKIDVRDVNLFMRLEE
jgi:hypothetical protein